MSNLPLDIGGDWGVRVGLFVRSDGHRVTISVRHPGAEFTVKGVDLLPEDMNDDLCLMPALAALNYEIRDWPVDPITSEQVRAA